MKLKLIFRNIYFTLRKVILRRVTIRRDEKSLKAAEIKSILVIRIDRIGDLIVSLPALEALKQTFPLTKISILLRQGNDALLDGIPGIDEVIPYRGFIKTLRRLRKGEFDLAVDLLMDYSLKTALLAYLSNAKLIVGFDIEGRGCFFNLKLKPASDKKHISQHILDLVRLTAKSRPGIDFPVSSFYPKLVILEQNRDYIRSFLKEKGIQEKDLLVGIHPGGHYPSQCWPQERFRQLADRVIKRYEAKVVVIGSSREENLVEQMIRLMEKEAVKVIGLSLDKLASLISLMHIFICNNSGPLHIASAVKTATVSTMGPTDPNLWRPQGEDHIVIRKDLSCSPCNRARCRRHDCMKLITVDEMMDAVNKQMENRIKMR